MENTSAQLDFFTPAPKELTWKEVLAGEREEPYFKSLLSFIESERTAGKRIYPKNSEIFNALNTTPFEKVRVVIIGQDPYHGPNQAHGLCFSVQPGIPFPPSLQNIFKEIRDDVGTPQPADGCLERWAQQGVLLLNAVLSVEAERAGSHANRGWERFTDRVIRELNTHRKGLVFLLWGSYAQKKCEHIDTTKHFILKAPHPSPLSAHRGFLGCRHFSKANQLLEKQGFSPIKW